MYLNHVTGFGAQAETHLEAPLNIEDWVYGPHRSACFLYKATGAGLQQGGIQDGSLLVVDRSLHPIDGAVVLANVGGEQVFRYYLRQGGQVYLANDNRRDRLTEADEIVGVVRACITKMVGDGKAHRTTRL